jgi:hypothetical protein
MFVTLQVVTVFLVGIAMTTALAHALEFPGKMRLDEKTYMAVQMIYYPGFTVAGVGEPLAVLATLVLTLLVRNKGVAFWCALSALVAVSTMHLVFWVVTQPVNRYWLRNQRLGTAGTKFFSLDRSRRSSTTHEENWQRLRDRWEYSHIVRAALSCIAMVSICVAVAV